MYHFINPLAFHCQRITVYFSWKLKRTLIRTNYFPAWSHFRTHFIEIRVLFTAVYFFFLQSRAADQSGILNVFAHLYGHQPWFQYSQLWLPNSSEITLRLCLPACHRRWHDVAKCRQPSWSRPSQSISQPCRTSLDVFFVCLPELHVKRTVREPPKSIVFHIHQLLHHGRLCLSGGADGSCA